MAAKVRLTVQSNFDEAGKDIQQFGKLTEEEMKRIENGLKKVNKQNLDSFLQKNKRMAAAVTATRGKMQGLKTESLALQRKMEFLIRNGMDPHEQALKKLQTEYVSTTQALEDMQEQQRISNKLMEKGKLVALGLGAALAAVAAKGTKDQADYAKEIANVNTLIDISENEFKQLDNTLRNISTDFAIQRRELGRGTYQAVSAGAESLNEALMTVEESSVLAKAALVDSEQSVDIITTAMNAYGKEVVSAAKASDIYFQTIKKGKITGEQLSATIGQSITLFSRSKIPIEELGAGVAALTKVGTKASEATTQLNAIVKAFIKPSEAMEAALAKTEHRTGSALLAAEGLAGALVFLQEQTGGSSEALTQLAPDVRSIRGVMSLAANNAKIFNEVLADFSSDKITGAAEKALKRQTEGYAANVFSIEQSIIALQNLAMVIGEILLPILGRLAQFITTVITEFGKLPGPVRLLLRLIPMLTASLGAFILALNIGTVAAKAGAALTFLGTKIAALGALIAAHPIGAFAVALAAVTSAVTLGIADQMETTSKTVATWAQATKKDYQSMIKLISEFEEIRGKDRGDRTKEEKKRMKLLEKQIERTTAGTLKWDKVSNQAFLDLGHNTIQTIETLEKSIWVQDRLAQKAIEKGKRETEAAEAEAKAALEAAEKKRKAEEALAKQRKLAAALRAQELKEVTKLKAQLTQDELTRGMNALDKENFLIEQDFQKKKALLIKFFGEETELLKALEANRTEELLEAQKKADELALKEQKTLRERIADEKILRFEANKQTIADLAQHFANVSELEDGSKEDKIARLGEEIFRISQIEGLSHEERILAHKALFAELDRLETDSTKNTVDNVKLRAREIKRVLGNTVKLFSSIDKIMENSGRESRAFAALQKAIAVASIGFDTQRAFVKTLADGGPFPLNKINAGLVLASGTAAGIEAATTPLPSAETGGTFTIPETGITRSDGSAIRVNPGETAEITPRGESPQKSLTVNVMLDGQVLLTHTQEGIDANEITITADNIRG